MGWRMRALLRTTIPVAALICSAPQLSAGSPAPESRFAQLDGAKVHYTDYGAGENALLFVHG